MSVDLLGDFRTIMAPFALITSCATLAWGLQGRFSRVVDAIRTLARELQEEGNEKEIVREEMRVLVRRTRWMRNGLVGYYSAMMAFLGTAVLLALAVRQHEVPPEAIVALFAVGLLTVCWTLGQVIIDTTRSFDAVCRDATRKAAPGPEGTAKP